MTSSNNSKLAKTFSLKIKMFCALFGISKQARYKKINQDKITIMTENERPSDNAIAEKVKGIFKDVFGLYDQLDN